MAIFELPGLSEDKVDVDAHDGNLTISGGAPESSERDGRFYRILKLPEGTGVSLFHSSLMTGG